MKCPECAAETRVVDCRESQDTMRRRRECLKCAHRFSTYEIVSTVFTDLSAWTITAMSVRQTLIDDYGASLPQVPVAQPLKLRPR